MRLGSCLYFWNRNNNNIIQIVIPKTKGGNTNGCADARNHTKLVKKQAAQHK